MRSGRLIIIGVVLLDIIVIILIATLAFIPQNANPAFAAAVEFTQAAGEGNDTVATALLDTPLQEYVQANCPEGSVSASAPPAAFCCILRNADRKLSASDDFWTSRDFVCLTDSRTALSVDG